MLGLPLGLVHLLNAVCVLAAVAAGPQGPWDDQGYAGVSAACFVSLCLSAIGGLITLIPSVRRAMGAWWLAPPLVLGVVAYVRMATLA
ncbi:hypothetical protein [Streptomyces goshikiensis]|uniref:hypothetical protein n=1 Tax=Streptomyces goshikiensis TaxID=1942 RepID=UPI0036AC6C8E